MKRPLDTGEGCVKRVWCVRHGQAEHNVAIEEEVAKFEAEGRKWTLTASEALGIRDPALTELGQRQARAAATDPLICKSALGSEGLDGHAELLVVSPLRRTLQTALGLREAANSADMKTIAHPDIQECMPVPCDTGRPLAELQQEFKDSCVIFCELEQRPDDWFQKPAPVTDDDEPNPEGIAALQERCRRFTQWLAARPEERIIVVAHHTLFCHLLNIDFLNCEVIEMTLHVPADKSNSCWEVAKASGTVVPLLTKEGSAALFSGSPPLSGTLATSLTKYGPEAARLTAAKAGLPDPLEHIPTYPAAIRLSLRSEA